MLESVDLSQKIGHGKYDKAIADLQLQLVDLQHKVRKKGIPVLVMYEGWDASGKGGSILRLVQHLDPRGYRVYPIGVPTTEELNHHYLWRFWTKIPAKGEIAIFDRSWYGRVLVERVEKLCKRDAWQRAYTEIRDFERTLVDNGVALVKFWMHISKDEQLRRFQERENNPFKQWKITPDDWENRKKWDDYLEAAEEMLRETDTPYAPWSVIPAENKLYARLATARIVAETMESAVK